MTVNVTSSDNYTPFMTWNQFSRDTADLLAQPFASLVSMVRDDFHFNDKQVRKASALLSSISRTVRHDQNSDSDFVTALGQGSPTPAAIILSTPRLQDLTIADKQILNDFIWLSRSAVELSSSYNSLLSTIEHEDTNQYIIWKMNEIISKWKMEGADIWSRGTILMQTLELEGFIPILDVDMSEMLIFLIQNGRSKLETDLKNGPLKLDKLIWTITECVTLAYPRELMKLGLTASVEKTNYHDMIFRKAVLPSSQFVSFLISNRYFLNADLFSLLMSLLDQILFIGPFHRPTLEFVLTSPIVMGFSSCLSYLENWSSLHIVLGTIKGSLQYWKEDCAELAQFWKQMIQAQFSEGFEDTLEQTSRFERGNFAGHLIVSERKSPQSMAPTRFCGTSLDVGNALIAEGGRQQVTELQREEIRKAFDCFDTDGSGSVNAFTALKVTLTVLGFQPKKADIRKLLQKERSDVVIDDNTLLDFNTFLDIVTEMMGTPPPERELYKAYHEMGGINPQTGEDRGLGVDELRIVAEERLGLKRGTQRMTDEELQEMVFQTLPKETQVLVMQGKIPLEQQRINLPDFLRMMKKTGQC
ncbi:hypothetical protein BLNAU_20536 [Blattamonas nauphoetae]|uniref:EF-hand domain-containing protein n=1 Tax=Blattamonas nauphoetae TaxID=2049346 RepID=A0ABQ9X2K8_9EUKA|nr:hypothetical protein BLNAU_20536 [Blattamonas nauphoetae]